MDTATRVISTPGAYLTEPTRADPERAVLDYVLDHARDFGLDQSDIRSLELADRYTSPDGVTHLRWSQRIEGIEVLGHDLRANVTGDGRLINVIGEPLADPGPLPAPLVSRRQALRGGNRSSARLRLVSEDDGPRPAWSVVVERSPVEVFDLVIDAVTGRVLSRSSRVSEANNASVFDNYPAAPLGGEQRTVDLSPWLFAPDSTSDLSGPNLFVFGDFDDDGVYTKTNGSGCYEQICPSNGAAPFQWLHPYPSIQVAGGNCPASGCGWDFNVPAFGAGSWFTTTKDRTGAQAFYLVNTFHDYLRDDPGIAFTAESGNFELKDRFIVHVVDGANRDGTGLPGANDVNTDLIILAPDGEQPRMVLALWRPTAERPTVSAVSSADDAGIVFHEYTHGLVNRLIVEPGGFLSGTQPSALGEGWADWYAMDYLVAQGLEADGPADGEVQIGRHIQTDGLRTEGLDCPTDSRATPCFGTLAGAGGGYTFGDLGKIFFGEPEPHSDGEIWAQTLWDLRDLVGSSTARSLVTGGLRLSPPDPTFLQARDAILAQARVIGGDPLVAQVASVFARRGMGASASTSGPDDTRPVEDFVGGVTCDGRLATIAGTNRAQRINGTNGPDVIWAGGGNDKIFGKGGADFICGGSGRDLLNGGAGADKLNGEAGRDTCVGGPAADRSRGCEIKRP